MSYYSKDYFNEVKKLGLKCVKKENLPEVWKKAIDDSRKGRNCLICTEDDLNSSAVAFAPSGTPEIAVSKNAMSTIWAFEKTMARSAGAGHALIGASRAGKEDSQVILALRENCNSGKWFMTPQEYATFKEAFTKLKYPVEDDDLEYFEKLEKIL